jgi:hypothetical protein
MWSAQQEVPIVPEACVTAGSQDHSSQVGGGLTNDFAPVFDGPGRVTAHTEVGPASVLAGIASGLPTIRPVSADGTATSQSGALYGQVACWGRTGSMHQNGLDRGLGFSSGNEI